MLLSIVGAAALKDNTAKIDRDDIVKEVIIEKRKGETEKSF